MPQKTFGNSCETNLSFCCPHDSLSIRPCCPVKLWMLLIWSTQLYVGLREMARYSRFTNNGGNVDVAYRKVWAAFLPLLQEHLPEDKLVHERLLITNGDDPARLVVPDLPTGRPTDVTSLIARTALENYLTPGPLSSPDWT